MELEKKQNTIEEVQAEFGTLGRILPDIVEQEQEEAILFGKKNKSAQKTSDLFKLGQAEMKLKNPYSLQKKKLEYVGSTL
jgi:hypothetical protein